MKIWIPVAILILALALRFFNLTLVHPSLYWDEGSMGSNAYTILNTGSDEYGNSFPLISIRSFDDYKPPMYVYLLIPVFSLFGVNDWSVRLVSAIAGVIAVGLTNILGSKLFGS